MNIIEVLCAKSLLCPPFLQKQPNEQKTCILNILFWYQIYSFPHEHVFSQSKSQNNCHLHIFILPTTIKIKDKGQKPTESKAVLNLTMTIMSLSWVICLFELLICLFHGSMKGNQRSFQLLSAAWSQKCLSSAKPLHCVAHWARTRETCTGPPLTWMGIKWLNCVVELNVSNSDMRTKCFAGVVMLKKCIQSFTVAFSQHKLLGKSSLVLVLWLYLKRML